MDQHAFPINMASPKDHIPMGAMGIFKPVFGTIGDQYVRFFISLEFNEAKTRELSYEHFDQVEMCEIVNDQYTKCHKRYVDLSMDQKVRYNEIYRRFKEQKDSTDTPIETWVAIAPVEKLRLANLGVATVEQIVASSPDQVARFGPGGLEIVDKAKKHVANKQEKIVAGKEAELMALRAKEREAEIAKLKAELEAVNRKSQEEFKKYVDEAIEKKGKRGRPRKENKEETHEETSIAA